jgi:hypothetical protein
MNICGAKEGWLVIFDPTPEKNWKQKITWDTTQFEEVTIHIVSC